MAIQYSNTRIGRLYKISTTLTPYVVLEQARKKILQGKITDSRDFQAFEDLLNDLYTNQNTAYLDSAVQNNILESIQEWISNEIIDIRQDIDSVFKGSRKKGVTEIRMSTVKARYDQMIKSLAFIEKELQSIDPINFNKSKQKLEKIQLEGLTLLKQIDGIRNGQSPIEDVVLSKTGKTIQFMGASKDKPSSFAEKFARIYRKLIHLNNLTAVYGKGLEKGLNVFSQMINGEIEKDKQSIINALLEDTEGEKQAPRGALSTGLFCDVYMTKNNNNDYKLFRNKDFMGPVRENFEYAEISGTYQDKKGKVDVTFKVPKGNNTSDTFKISAKSWSTGVSSWRTFNETSLENALLRTVGLDKTIAYGLVLGTYQENTYLRFHSFAQACAIVDIVMGYSQNNSYADTIVIQDRSNAQRPIKVYSIEKIFNNLINKMDTSSVKGYDESKLYTALKFNNSKNIGNSGGEWYVAKILSALRVINLEVSAKLIM